MMIQKPGLAARRCGQCEHAPNRVAQADIEILVDEKDAAFRGEKSPVVNVRISLKSVWVQRRPRNGCAGLTVGKSTELVKPVT